MGVPFNIGSNLVIDLIFMSVGESLLLFAVSALGGLN